MVFVYQGEEIGMTNVTFPSFVDYNNIETVNAHHHLVNEKENVLTRRVESVTLDEVGE